MGFSPWGSTIFLPIAPSDFSLNRVGGGLTAPASHTTVHAVRHTAVREKHMKR